MRRPNTPLLADGTKNAPVLCDSPELGVKLVHVFLIFGKGAQHKTKGTSGCPGHFDDEEAR